MMCFTNYRIILLVFLFLSFECHAGPAEDWVSKVQVAGAEKGYDELFSESETKEFLDEAELIAQKGTNNPVFWYHVGVFNRIKFYYFRELKKSIGNYNPNSPETKGIIQKYQLYYLKALDNDNPDATNRLDAEALTYIANDGLVASEIQARAMKKVGDLAREGRGGSESLEWNSYEARLGIYNQAGDFDNYLKTVNEMIERFPNTSRMEELQNYKQQVEALIENRDRETALQDGEGAGISSAGPVEPQAGRADQAKPVARPKQPEPRQTHQPMLLWLLAGGGIVLLAVAAVFISRRRKRG